MKICNDKKGADKRLHVFVSFCIGAVFGAALSLFRFPSAFIPAAVTLVLTLAVGVAKELHDRRKKGNHFCIWDLLADLIGAVCAAMLAFCANYYTWHDAAGNILN